jgi:excisionase family DNA binding protein
MQTSNASVPKLAWSLAEMEVATGLSRATLYNMIADGRLQTVKIGGRRLVPAWQAQSLLAVADTRREVSAA